MAVFAHALILIMKLIGKIIGVPVTYFFFLIDKIFKINTRAYARNRVYYMQNNINLLKNIKTFNRLSFAS